MKRIKSYILVKKSILEVRIAYLMIMRTEKRIDRDRDRINLASIVVLDRYSSLLKELKRLHRSRASYADQMKLVFEAECLIEKYLKINEK